MKTAPLIFIALAFIGVAVANPLIAFVKAHADNHILNKLAATNSLSASSNPEYTSECFSYYLPILNQISNNFSVQYQQCITKADTSTANLTARAAENRVSFVNNTAAICSAFTTCNRDNDTMDFFNCYATASSADVTAIYSLSDSVSNAAFSFKTGLQEIKNTEDLCTHDVEHTYVVQTSETYEELNECMLYGLPSSTSTAVSTNATTSASSSVSPDASTTTVSSVA
ncbi:uncharacterized protein LOC129244131 [Anastrepha obliqua]|uniref:uncharacterized protein LOC129244131 n=1 Tax=Anastrepha obliqua TaxID=95512 RepID=UPI002409CF34|nr:uncharacterized protein LOC129244131 [Anastrepha obliqua]